MPFLRILIPFLYDLTKYQEEVGVKQCLETIGQKKNLNAPLHPHNVTEAIELENKN